MIVVRFVHAQAAGRLFAHIRIVAPIVMEPDIAVVAHRRETGDVLGGFRLRDHLDAVWLPAGEYLLALDFGGVASGDVGAIAYRLSSRSGGQAAPLGEGRLMVEVADQSALQALEHRRAGQWLIPIAGSTDIDQLSWRKGAGDWFYRHFDHASRTIGSYMLGDSPLLQGDVLDVGCGDGITDLGFALHYQPRSLIGIDPFCGFERLPDILEKNHVPADAVPKSLRFLSADGNHLPFPDDSFDVVISWGSLEHIVGGYKQCLREIKRVLRPDGLFFVHPGLFYSTIGNHLGEFSSEPHIHLKLSEDALHDLVLSTPPSYMDRSGLEAKPEEYWQWYKELNPITVSGFEQELRAMEFEPWRVAIRTVGRVEYTPELLRYPMQDLATDELYVSCWNRKPARPQGYRQDALSDHDTAG